jgi:Protein of unknown function (DUF2026)
MKPPKVAQKLLIPLPDYVRLFRVMQAVIEKLDADSNKASLFFCMVGAALLQHFYKMEARVIAGSAFFLVDEKSRTILSITKSVDGGPSLIESDRKGFHCWLECEGQIIDFQALAFPAALARMGSPIRIPCQMFQKQKATMSSSLESLNADGNVGDFYLQPNIALTNELVHAFLASLMQMDLMGVCIKWFARPPKKIAGAILVQPSEGAAYELSLRNIEAAGVW